MANSSLTQQGLASSPHFHKRIGSALSSVAWEVINEAADVPGHTQRAAYTRAVLDYINQKAQAIAPWFVERPNLMAFETSYDFSAAAVVTAAGDADLESQLMTDWNDLAGVVPEPPAGTR